MRKMTIVMVITLIFLFTAVVFAKGQVFHRENNFQNKGKSLLEKMNLSESQILQLKVINADQRRKLIQVKADVDFIEIKKKQIIRDRNFKLSDYKAEIKKTIELLKKIETIKLDSIERTRKVLTDAQWKIFCVITSQGERRSPRATTFSRNSRGRKFPGQAMEY